MRWSLDTHKYMSEVTRTALQIISKAGITSYSSEQQISAVEHQLALAGVYKDEAGAKGRVRRALFTYFRAYECIDDNEHLTELGKAFVENELSIREFSLRFLACFRFSENGVSYYPLHMILAFYEAMKRQKPNCDYITPNDFSSLSELDSLDKVDDAFVAARIAEHSQDLAKIEQRSVGFDVWSKMLVQSGLCRKVQGTPNLVLANAPLAEWLLESYKNAAPSSFGKIITGVFQYLPKIKCSAKGKVASQFLGSGKALGAFLFDDVPNSFISKYLYTGKVPFDAFIDGLGLASQKAALPAMFGLERLLGRFYCGTNDYSLNLIGSLLLNAEIPVFDGPDAISFDAHERLPGGENTILYGVPGSGKSHAIGQDYCSDDDRMERVVFHPDFTYSDFVGQILPVIKDAEEGKGGRIEYEFVPGPFTSILKRAYLHPEFEFFLVIEEINRGNAPAIFGDVFQLLDRKPTGERKGESEYGITNSDIAKEVYGDPNHMVKIPSNLSILGTMNTSDQNVFTLDTAFQRRWNMRLIENVFQDTPDEKKFADTKILDTTCSWRRFCEKINLIIVNKNVSMASSEDKRLGTHFINVADLLYVSVAGLTGRDLVEAQLHNRRFPEKVIKYLWDDAFKFNREEVFDITRYESLESVIRKFIGSIGDERFDVFLENIRDDLFKEDK